jgi:hypothetical protein
VNERRVALNPKNTRLQQVATIIAQQALTKKVRLSAKQKLELADHSMTKVLPAYDRAVRT